MNFPSFTNVSRYEYQNWFTGNFQELNYRSPVHHPAWLENIAKRVGFEDTKLWILTKCRWVRLGASGTFLGRK